MDLILWRHAQAQEWTDGGDDRARSLTSRGEKQAAQMARWLNGQLPENTRILVSPARRAEQTALALGRKYQLREELEPGASVAQLLDLVQWPGAKSTVLVVGHQPTLGQTIAQLLGLSSTQCAVKKGAVWWLRCRPHQALSDTVIVAMQSPEII